MAASFVVARNPDETSSLPYLVRLPIEGGLALKVRDTWPRSARVYCHRLEDEWPGDAEVLEEVGVVLCRRRGPAIDLVLDRPRLFRSQFVFTESKGRQMIFWQTQVTARRANPAGRVPRHRLLDEVRIAVDTRERYPYRFANRPVSIERVALSAGDYGVFVRERLVATVERKTLENFVSCLSDGTLAFQLQRLSAVPLAAVVVEAKYADLFRQPGGRANFFADVLARLQVRYHEVAVVFADSRKFAEEWAYRFLATAAADASAGSSAEEHPDEEP